ncbi:hypothetical protein BGZ50_007843 [Haplosporangium sp. Z 11]|nr:hypothetical protein BGZ50_007843 [Haplosporangium sp. Z 11]
MYLNVDSVLEEPLPVQPSTLSSPISDSSSVSSSSVSNSVLTRGALHRMRTEFSTAFNEYQGAPWLLSTGANVDDILYRHVMTLDVESALHSFVLDQTGSVMHCFEEKDRDLFQDFVNRRDSVLQLTLPQWMQDEILQYSLAPEALWDQLSCGWKRSGQNILPATVEEVEFDRFRKALYRTILCLSCLYEGHGNKLSKSKSESWYATKVWSIFFELLVWGSEWLEFEPGEVYSSASSQRKNKDRELDTRHALGRKIDGLITCGEGQYEIGAVEIGKTDEGTTGTKVLSDGRKLAKLLKDMFDTIGSQCLWAGEIKGKLQVYGLLVSGLRVEFVTLRYLEGRFYRLTREHTISIPLKWTEKSIRRILVVVTEFLLFKNRMETMAKLVEDWSNPDIDELKSMVSGSVRSCTPPPHARTLSTPKNSPKRRR